MKRAAVAVCTAPFRGQDPSLEHNPLPANSSAQETIPEQQQDGLAVILQAVLVCSPAPGALVSSPQPLHLPLGISHGSGCQK